MSRPPRRVVVVGSGLAGLAAALEAADQGAAVTLLERRPRLGGATWSFRRRGIWFDNGQHVFLRCCTGYLRFLKRIGSRDGVFLQKRLDLPVVSPDGRSGAIRRSAGPAPLHLGPALMSYPYLSLNRRLGAIRAALALRRLDPEDPRLDDVSFGEWLDRHGQDPVAVENFWDLIVLPTINVAAADASLKLAAKVFVTGLLTEAPAADIGWARIPLSALHGEASRRALESAGARILTRAAVTGIRPGPGGRLVVHARGEALEADSAVVAVPHNVVDSLLPPGSVPAQNRLVRLGVSPIVNVHLVYDRPVTDHPMMAAVGSDVQYVFDRTEAAGVDDGRQCLAISLSAARAYATWNPRELVSHFRAELARLLPAAAGASLTESIVTRETEATFYGAPGTHRLRPGVETRIPGVYLAGAWCATGWPATMEGAVRSGAAAGRRAADFARTRASGAPAAALPAPVPA